MVLEKYQELVGGGEKRVKGWESGRREKMVAPPGCWDALSGSRGEREGNEGKCGKK